MIHELDFTAPCDAREREARRLANGADDAAAAYVLGLSPGLAPEKAKVPMCQGSCRLTVAGTAAAAAASSHGIKATPRSASA